MFNSLYRILNGKLFYLAVDIFTRSFHSEIKKSSHFEEAYEKLNKSITLLSH